MCIVWTLDTLNDSSISLLTEWVKPITMNSLQFVFTYNFCSFYSPSIYFCNSPNLTTYRTILSGNIAGRLVHRSCILADWRDECMWTRKLKLTKTNDLIGIDKILILVFLFHLQKELILFEALTVQLVSVEIVFFFVLFTEAHREIRSNCHCYFEVFTCIFWIGTC